MHQRNRLPTGFWLIWPMGGTDRRWGGRRRDPKARGYGRPQLSVSWPPVGHGYISPPKTNTSAGIFRVLVTPWVLETPLFLCLFRLTGGNVVSSRDTFF